MSRLEVGDKAPEFTLPDDTGTEVSLADFRGRKVVLYVYPAAMTPGCTTQACDFRDSLEQLAKFRERDHLTFPLLSDQEKGVLEAYGAYGEKKLYGKTVIGVIRSTFVIDEDGSVEKAMYNVKATGHVEKLRRDLAI
jgi:thioredoxin-dependent peroxiredoxin